MNIQQLNAFVAISENKSITQAAGKLFVSQPALSRHLTLLEEELGCQLVVRNNHGIELTAAGEILYKRSKRLLEDLLDTKALVREAAIGVHGTINIGTIYSAFPRLVSCLSTFRENYPNINIRLIPQVPSQLLDQLSDGKLHVACLRLPMAETKNWPCIQLSEEKSLLAIHENMDPCPETDEISVEMLRGIPFCSGILGNRERRVWDYANMLQEECRKHNFELNMAFECSGIISRIMLVSAGLAACFIPAEIMALLDCKHVHLKEVTGFSVYSSPIIIWNDQTYKSRPVQLFLEYFQGLERDTGKQKS